MNRPRRAGLTGLLAAVVVMVAASACTAPRFPSVGSGRTTSGDPGWRPRAGLVWQIQLSGAFDPNAKANVYDLDAYTTSQETVSNLHAAGRQTVCHLDVGVSDLAVPDATRFPEAVLGATDGPGRVWLDIRQWSVIEPILADRVRLCADKGFDAVDADLGYGYTTDTGFGLTAADQVVYDRRVAAMVHSLGLAVAVRTPPDLATPIEPYVDFTVADGCFQNADCRDYFVYIDAGKAVFDVETDAPADFCALARAYGFSAIRKRAPLDGYVQPCRPEPSPSVSP